MPKWEEDDQTVQNPIPKWMEDSRNRIIENGKEDRFTPEEGKYSAESLKILAATPLFPAGIRDKVCFQPLRKRTRSKA